MFIVTFYSYKGGVGRTMALVNTAVRLSAKRKRVFILDFDLEAPGIEVFESAQEPRSGIVEFVSEYLKSRHVPPLADYVSEINLGKGQGKVFCMQAGKGDPSYQRQLASLDWKRFYAHEEGYTFVENLKGAIEAEYAPDYVLVDSRTGLTDSSGICTLQLPNLDVLVFGLNDQNLRGTTRILESIKTNSLNRPIETLLVASPVPDDVTDVVGLRDQRMTRVHELMGRGVDLTLPFAPFMAFKETVLTDSETFLGQAYDKLTQKIIDLNKSDILNLLEQARDLLRVNSDPHQAELKYQEIVEAYPKDPHAWHAYGVFLRISGNLSTAIAAFKKAIELGGLPVSRAQLALSYLAEGQIKMAGSTFDEFLSRSKSNQQIQAFTEIFASQGAHEIAIAGYTRLLDLSSGQPETFATLIGLGNVYSGQSNFQAAVGLYKRAVDLVPTNLAGNYNYAHALYRLGRIQECLPYFQKATGIFEQSEMSKLTPAVRANRFEGMGLAYRVLGNPSKSEENFQLALGATEGLSKTSLFSALHYKQVSIDEFRDEVRVELAKVNEL